MLVGELILLHASSRCKALRSLDISWSNVSDIGIQAFAEAVERYAYQTGVSGQAAQATLVPILLLSSNELSPKLINKFFLVPPAFDFFILASRWTIFAVGIFLMLFLLPWLDAF